MKVSRHASPVAIQLAFVFLLLIPVTQPTLFARAGQKPGDIVGVPRGGVPDPCEQAAVAQGEAKGLHDRCEAAGGGGGVARGDFNADGFADLAIGAPYEDIDGINAPGMVQILYGSSAGLTANGDQAFDLSTFGFTLQTDAHFGWAIASGDFNGDTFSDLAVSAPDYDVTQTDGGVVFLMNGSSTGLQTSTRRTLPDFTLRGRLGAALVWGNFNGDDYGDLAVGAPDADPPGETPALGCSRLGFGATNAGVVQVFYGSSDGLTQFGGQVLRQGVCDFGQSGVGIGDSMEDNDRFGSALTALRSGDEGPDDLVIGVPTEDLGLFDKIDAGVIHFVPGFSTGLDPRNAILISQDTPGIGGGAESGDQFGRVLAGGNFNGGQPDLAVGVPFEDLTNNTEADAGAVNVLFDFNAFGFDAAESQFISQNNVGSNNVETGDRFGWALAAGDFDGDGRDDLAIGAPTEDVGTLENAGIVHVLYGTSVGVSFTRVQSWTQDSTGIADVAEPGDQFGYALSAWNFGNGARRDLAIGVPFEDLTSTVTNTLMQDAGAVHVLYGITTTGLSATNSQFWTQDSTGILDSSQPGDRFGNSLY
jgi:hypothetical protein